MLPFICRFLVVDFDVILITSPDDNIGQLMQELDSIGEKAAYQP